MKKKEKEELKCGSLPTADIVGAVGKTIQSRLHLLLFGWLAKLKQ